MWRFKVRRRRGLVHIRERIDSLLEICRVDVGVHAWYAGQQQGGVFGLHASVGADPSTETATDFAKEGPGEMILRL
jgi:hypothetical protein